MSVESVRGQVRVVPAAEARKALEALKAEGYTMMVDMTCVDYLKEGRDPRFDVVYRLMKFDLETGHDQGRVELHAAVGETPVLRSAMDLWPIADWLEREIWDMYGVGFTDRPGIKRLLMYEEFEGHALRKDYPIAKRQPLIGPKSGDKEDSPSFNILKPTVTGE
jgi:NADH-quinone oxidoreductase subunit C